MIGLQRYTKTLVCLLVITALAPGELLAAEGLRYAGATTLQRDFMPEATRQFEKEFGVPITISGGNTKAGLQALLDGSADLAGSGRFLTAAEKASGLVETLIGWDALTVVVHATNPIENLTMEQLQRLASGKITNWREVGGRDLPVLFVVAPSGSGMRDAVERLVLQGGTISSRAIICMVVADADLQVAQLPAGFTILSNSMVDAENLKKVRLSGELPTAQSVAAKRYPLVKPLLLVSKGQPRGGVAKFVNFSRSAEGQAILARKFIPLSL